MQNPSFNHEKNLFLNYQLMFNLPNPCYQLLEVYIHFRLKKNHKGTSLGREILPLLLKKSAAKYSSLSNIVYYSTIN